MSLIAYFHQLAERIINTKPKRVIIHDIPIYLDDRDFHYFREDLFMNVDPKKFRWIEPEKDYYGRLPRYYGARRGHWELTIDVGPIEHVHFRVYPAQEEPQIRPIADRLNRKDPW